MMQTACLAVIVLAGLALWLARRCGRQSARIEALKKEAQEYAKAQQISNRVRRMSMDDVRRRLQNHTQ